MPNQNTNPPQAPVRPAPTNTTTTKPHHPVRTVFASLLGALAVLLILFSVFAVWLNRTLTDTPTYVAVVGPLATKPEIQNFVATKVSEALVKNAPTQDLANALLPNDPQKAAKTNEQLKVALEPVVYKNVMQVVSSEQFATVWQNTNQTAHAELVKQLSSDSDQLTLDLHPILINVVGQLKTTQLGQFSDQIEISPDAGKLNLKSSGIDKAHSYYKLFQRATIAIVVAAIAAFALAIVISVDHAKTLRRILMMTGVSSLLVAFAVQLPSLIIIKGTGDVTQKAIVVITQSTLHNLQLASIIIGVLCIAVAVGSKIYSKAHTKK